MAEVFLNGLPFAWQIHARERDRDRKTERQRDRETERDRQTLHFLFDSIE